MKTARLGILVALTCGVGVALALALRGRSPGSPEDILTAGEALYSQHDEELIIRHFFDDRREGFFVDVGSFHWKKKSTTYYLEKHLGWSGIAIDAQPGFAAGYRTHRPATTFLSYIVTDHSGTLETLYLARALSSTSRELIRRFPKTRDLEPREISVPTITLDEALDQNGVSRIDFLSMDIEGGEPPALAGFDIRRFRPELVCIESDPSTRAAILAYFTERGYERLDAYLAYDNANWYFAPRGGS